MRKEQPDVFQFKIHFENKYDCVKKFIINLLLLSNLVTKQDIISSKMIKSI